MTIYGLSVTFININRKTIGFIWNTDPQNLDPYRKTTIMWQILPIIILPMATILIAYILEFSTYLFGQLSLLMDGIPDWTPTVVLSIVVLVTYRSLKASLSQDN